MHSAAGLDFIDPGEIPLQFDSTATSQTVRIIIIDDTILEADENFFGRLVTTDAAVNVDPSEAEATIVEDNDGMFCCGCCYCGAEMLLWSQYIMWILLINSS